MRTRLLAALLTVVASLGLFTSTYLAAPDPQVRVVELSRPRNLRSLGGLPARGGALQDRMLYRSARLTKLSRPDASVVNALGLRTIVDFRMGVEKLIEGHDSRTVTEGLRQRVSLPLAIGFNMSSSSYRALLRHYGVRRNIQRFFAILADPGAYPVLYHCSAGKDRTGIMTSILLMALGTPRPIIEEDYLASSGPVRREWLQAVFEEVDRAGGIEAFLALCSVPIEQVEAVRAHLVKSPSVSSRR